MEVVEEFRDAVVEPTLLDPIGDRPTHEFAGTVGVVLDALQPRDQFGGPGGVHLRDAVLPVAQLPALRRRQQGGGVQPGGGLRPGVTPEIAARGTIAMMDGLQVQWLLDPATIGFTAR